MPPAYVKPTGCDLGDIARAWGCTMREAAERLGPAGGKYFQMDEADVRRILAFPGTMIGSDGLPRTTSIRIRACGGRFHGCSGTTRAMNGSFPSKRRCAR
jgi:hypothetical protein